jgi:flagellar biosynthesis GTPase FlhF
MALVSQKPGAESDDAKARLAEEQKLRREAYAKQRELETSKDESIQSEEDDARAFFLAQRKRQMVEAAQQNRQQDEEAMTLASIGGTLLVNAPEQGTGRFDFFSIDDQNHHLDRAPMASEC